MEGPAHPGHRLPAGSVPAIADGVLGLHGTVGLCRLHHKGVGADKAAQQAQIDPQKVGEALPGAAQVSFSGGFLHRPGLEALHREDDALFAPIQQKHRHAGGQAADEVLHLLDRTVLGGQTGVVHQKFIDLCAAVGQPLRLEAGRMTGGSVQQERPKRLEAGHVVEEHDGPRTVIKLDALGIKIRRSAKPSVERLQILIQQRGKLQHTVSPFACQYSPVGVAYSTHKEGLL